MQYTLPRAANTIRINCTHLRSLSMVLEVNAMIAILSESKPPDYFFL